MIPRTTQNPPPVIAPITATGNPRPAPNAEAGPSVLRPSRAGLSSAEAYANAHYPSSRRDRDKSTGGVVSKPIFDWISRKLGGAGRRATITEIGPHVGRPPSPRARYPTLPKHARGTGWAYRDQVPLSPAEIFAPSTFSRETNNSVSRSESHSLRSYSFGAAVSEARREANNPYPSIPVPQLHRELTNDNDESFISRSRTSSVRSEGSITSSMPPRISLADDGSSFRLSRYADENASLRPLPPSHRGSPTPSTSMLSRSASASLLSPQPSRRPTSPSLRVRPETRYSGSTGADRSFTSSEPEDNGRQSRRDSSSTKPTIVSVDGPLPTTHIAQVPNPPSPLRGSLARASDEVPPPTTPSIPTSSQAPKHSHPHPRDNPRPSSPPDPNASTLTLASSTFAVPIGSSISPSVATSLYNRPSSLHGIHLNTSNTQSSPLPGVSPITTPLTSPPHHRPQSLSTSPSVTWAPGYERNSIADYPPSLHPTLGTSFRTGGWAGGRGAADRDASVRAVRRKGSWESYESGWSWRGANGILSPTGAPPREFISPPPLLEQRSSDSVPVVGADFTPRMGYLAPALDLPDATAPDPTPTRDRGSFLPRDGPPFIPRPSSEGTSPFSTQLQLNTGIAA